MTAIPVVTGPVVDEAEPEEAPVKAGPDWLYLAGYMAGVGVLLLGAAWAARRFAGIGPCPPAAEQLRAELDPDRVGGLIVYGPDGRAYRATLDVPEPPAPPIIDEPANGHVPDFDATLAGFGPEGSLADDDQPVGPGIDPQ